MFQLARTVDTQYSTGTNGRRQTLLCSLLKVLVFRSRSSPTIWGRFAAFMGRTMSAVIPEAEGQVYTGRVRSGAGDDQDLYLWAAIMGYILSNYPNRWQEAVSNGSERRSKSTTPRTRWSSPYRRTRFLRWWRPVRSSWRSRWLGPGHWGPSLVPLLRPFLSSVGGAIVWCHGWWPTQTKDCKA